jgi:hypothetical protein
MHQPGLDDRHRDKNGEISRKHGDTLISTLRQTYGRNFAPEFGGNVRLSQVLQCLDEPSLSQMVRDLSSPMERIYARTKSGKIAVRH